MKSYPVPWAMLWWGEPGEVTREVAETFLVPSWWQGHCPPGEGTHLPGWDLSPCLLGCLWGCPCLTSPAPALADEMNDHQNTLSYVLINPPPDTRLELNDIV